MKQVKRPTRRQKVLIQENRLNPDNWLVERDTGEELVLWNKETNRLRMIRRVK